MIHKISYYFSIKLSSNTDEQEILQYGFECLINSIIPISFFFTFRNITKYNFRNANMDNIILTLKELYWRLPCFNLYSLHCFKYFIWTIHDLMYEIYTFSPPFH